MSEKYKFDLSIAMIVKNEEKVLRRCLDSMRPLRDEISCELIITDTGSTDSTIEIAKEYADVFLEFEWCNDFAKARNTGVKAARGRWFMYVDADEYFDDTVREISDFIKSANSRNVPYASIISRSYNDNEFKVYSDSYLPRLINFGKDKQFFKGFVHETIYIEPTKNAPAIESVLHHTGYIGNRLEKTTRNGELIDKEIKANPADLRFYLLKCDNFDDKEIGLSVCKQAMDVAIKTKQMNSVYIEYLHVLTCKCYYALERYDEMFEYADKYLEKEKRTLISKQEILYFCASAAYKNKQFEKAIPYMLGYKKNYEDMQVNFDNIYSMFGVYTFNKEKNYLLGQMTLSHCYDEVGDSENAVKTLDESKAYRYHTPHEGYVCLIEYIKLAKKLDAFYLVLGAYKDLGLTGQQRLMIINHIESVIDTAVDLAEKKKMLECFENENFDAYTPLNWFRVKDYKPELCEGAVEVMRNDEITYTCPVFADAFFGTYVNGVDVLGYFNRFSIERLKHYTIIMLKKYGSSIAFLHSCLMRYAQADVADIKLKYFNSYVAFKFLAYYSGDNINKTPQIITALNEIFFFFVRNTCECIIRMYNVDNFEANSSVINPIDAFCYYANKALLQKEENPTEFIRGMRRAMRHCENLSKCVNILIDEYKKQVDSNDSARTEFLMLGEQVKAQIKQLVVAGDYNNATAVLDQYAKVNPTDYEIADLYDEIERKKDFANS